MGWLGYSLEDAKRWIYEGPLEPDAPEPEEELEEPHPDREELDRLAHEAAS